MSEPAREIADLHSLDRSLVHVFVSGPGYGEGIAVALPEQGWLLIDSCRTGLELPLEAIVQKWRLVPDEPIVALILTHPHQDHCEGIAELIESLMPRVVAITAANSASQRLLEEAVLHQSHAQSTSERLRAGAVQSAFIAIQRWSEVNRRSLIYMHDGAAIPVQPSPAAVYVRAPDRSGLEAFFENENLHRALRRNANHISAVLEIIFDQATIVLGGDLPRYWPDSTRPVATGWDLVLATHPGLAKHRLLKIPHHGSREAQHPDLLGGQAGRIWCVTPYNSSRLPRTAAGDGLSILLEHEDRVHLTAIPASRYVQAAQPHPGVVTQSQVGERMQRQSTGDPFLDAGVDIRPGTACGPLDAVWCVAFGADGTVRGRWRGRSSLEVVRD